MLQNVTRAILIHVANVAKFLCFYSNVFIAILAARSASLLDTNRRIIIKDFAHLDFHWFILSSNKS